MISDLNTYNNQEKLKADICIVGGGVMGIAIAYCFLNSNQRVLIVESGGEEPSASTQRLNEVIHLGIKPIFNGAVSRQRVAGGSSNCWEGYNIPFDQHVVDEWPCRAKGLTPYWQKVHDFLQLEGFWEGFDKPHEYIEDKVSFAASLAPLKLQMRQQHGIRLWQSYRSLFLKSKNIEFMFNANLTGLGLQKDSSTVKEVYVSNLHSKSAVINATKYVIATSGIGNSSLLLNLDRRLDGALLKGNKNIGRYFADHVEIHDRFIPHVCFPGFRSLKKSSLGVQKFLRPHFRLLNGGTGKPLFIDHAIELKPDSPKTASDFCNEGVPSVGGGIGSFLFAPTPYNESRIYLSERKNALGFNLPVVDWKQHPGDKQKTVDLARKVEKTLLIKGIGRVSFSKRLQEGRLHGRWDENGSCYNGKHWMGGTRMGSSFENSIVDKNCKLWGVDNLYIAGASVFPSFGWPGPTYTALGLSMRLASHLDNA